MKPTDPGLTRARKRILEFAENHGIEIVSIEWTPIGRNMEMCGPEGGWVVIDTHQNHFVGYNVAMVLDDIEYEAKHGIVKDQKTMDLVEAINDAHTFVPDIDLDATTFLPDGGTLTQELVDDLAERARYGGHTS